MVCCVEGRFTNLEFGLLKVLLFLLFLSDGTHSLWRDVVEVMVSSRENDSPEKFKNVLLGRT